MTTVTLALATLGSLVALRSRPSLALSVYCAGLLLYPQALTIQVGGADFSLSRILILAVLANAILRAELYRTFQWSWMDTFLSASYLLGFIALLSTVGMVAVERHSGAFFDTMLPYFAARLIVTDEDSFVTLAKGLAVIAVPLVGLGTYQMFTGQNPIGDLSVYYHFGLGGERGEDHIPRLGLYRAVVTFEHPIAFGLFCAMAAPLTLSLWHQQAWPKSVVLALAAVSCCGVFASLSDGPLLSVACTALVFISYVHWRLGFRLVLYGSIFLVIFMWYVDGSYVDALASLTFKPVNALYRFGLIGEALGGGMSGHWLTGYGYVGVGPGTDNTGFHWQHDDLVNLYIQVLVRTGLLGLTPYVLANCLYYVRLLEAIRIPSTPRAIWLAVSLLAAMVGWNVAMMTVGGLSQILQLLYIAVAMSANTPAIVTAEMRRVQ
jgi:hypothetical protein